MSWFMAGAAAVTVATSLYSSSSAKSSAIKSANTASRAEGQATVRERMNKTLNNSYSTAFAQMQLALEKRQLADQGAKISAAELAAQGDATLATAATGSIGATTQSVVADINQKADQAKQTIADAWEMAQINFNNNLDMMVVNTDQSAPNVRANEYNGPSTGAMIGGALLAGASQFASSYAMKSMSLGTGSPNVPSNVQGPSPYSLSGMPVRF